MLNNVIQYVVILYHIIVGVPHVCLEPGRTSGRQAVRLSVYQAVRLSGCLSVRLLGCQAAWLMRPCGRLAARPPKPRAASRAGCSGSPKGTTAPR